MPFVQKPRVVIRSHDPKTARDLKRFLPEGCDLHPIQDLKSIDALCRDKALPHAMIIETPFIAAAVSGEQNGQGEVMHFLQAARGQYPVMRRIVIADEDDFSIAIDGLHTGAIDSLLYRPFQLADVLTALRFPKCDANRAAATTTVSR